ncbi:Aldose 1-epimerase [Massilia sp. Bi118]|uniref:aldose epimerase family protein n=1 Tax=Massilia sp. Bi118 TaxID=2822346 RepID=UPI001D2D2D6F|nr:aldose epimerase family protein [Massilia sp. Bi118]CAH0267747.1 Aldose 1-epimerase [Massilia sp. Bi118]
MHAQTDITPGITQAPFGSLPDGAPVTEYTLVNRHGMRVAILDFGGIIRRIHVPDRDGRFADVALGFDELEPYLGASPYFGALIGRYGNRIAKGRFVLDGHKYELATNNGNNHLHGGDRGFDKVLWQAEAVGGELRLRYFSPDGEEGYPGNLDARVVYSLTDDNEIVVRFSATTDKPTPVNLTQHSYFNLAGIEGCGDILGHEILIDAAGFVPIDAESIPLGGVRPVEDSAFDFRQARTIGSRIGEQDEQLANGQGYDHCFVLDRPAGGRALARAVRVRDPGSGRVLELLTQEPGVQFYSGNFLDGTLAGKGCAYPFRGGFAIEPEHFPDSPNQPDFPNTILRPGQTYATESRFRFSVDD